jgi:hypothetical protein
MLDIPKLDIPKLTLIIDDRTQNIAKIVSTLQRRYDVIAISESKQLKSQLVHLYPLLQPKELPSVEIKSRSNWKPRQFFSQRS